MGPKNGGFGGKWGVTKPESKVSNLRFWFRDPQKALPCAEPRRLTYFVKIGARVSAVAFLKNPQKKYPSHFLPRGAKSRMRRTETPEPIWRGQIFPSPIDFHRRPYNTLALPCERVI